MNDTDLAKEQQTVFNNNQISIDDRIKEINLLFEQRLNMDSENAREKYVKWKELTRYGFASKRKLEEDVSSEEEDSLSDIWEHACKYNKESICRLIYYKELLEIFTNDDEIPLLINNIYDITAVLIVQRAYRKRKTDREAQRSAMGYVRAKQAKQRAAELKRQEAEQRRKLAQAERQMAYELRRLSSGNNQANRGIVNYKQNQIPRLVAAFAPSNNVSRFKEFDLGRRLYISDTVYFVDQMRFIINDIKLFHEFTKLFSTINVESDQKYIQEIFDNLTKTIPSKSHDFLFFGIKLFTPYANIDYNITSTTIDEIKTKWPLPSKNPLPSGTQELLLKIGDVSEQVFTTYNTAMSKRKGKTRSLVREVLLGAPSTDSQYNTVKMLSKHILKSNNYNSNTTLLERAKHFDKISGECENCSKSSCYICGEDLTSKKEKCGDTQDNARKKLKISKGNIPVNPGYHMEIEHILPFAYAYAYTAIAPLANSIKDVSEYIDKDNSHVIKLLNEYAPSHRCCNQTKSNKLFLNLTEIKSSVNRQNLCNKKITGELNSTLTDIKNNINNNDNDNCDLPCHIPKNTSQTTWVENRCKGIWDTQLRYIYNDVQQEKASTVGGLMEIKYYSQQLNAAINGVDKVVNILESNGVSVDFKDYSNESVSDLSIKSTVNTNPSNLIKLEKYISTHTRGGKLRHEREDIPFAQMSIPHEIEVDASDSFSKYFNQDSFKNLKVKTSPTTMEKIDRLFETTYLYFKFISYYLEYNNVFNVKRYLGSYGEINKLVKQNAVRNILFNISKTDENRGDFYLISLINEQKIILETLTPDINIIPLQQFINTIIFEETTTGQLDIELEENDTIKAENKVNYINEIAREDSEYISTLRRSPRLLAKKN